MIENVGRKIILIGALLGVSILLLVLPSPSLRMGLDLAGGLRLVYRIPFEEAIEEGVIEEGSNRDEIMRETMKIVRMRVDPQGILEPIIRLVGDDLIEIAIPGAAEFRAASAVATLAQPLSGPSDDGSTVPFEIELVSATGDNTDLAGFPSGGGKVRIGDEEIRYTRRSGNRLTGLERARGTSKIAAHAADASVTLISNDQIQAAIENLGDMRFMMTAKDGDPELGGAGLTAERTKLRAWYATNPQAPIAAYNALPFPNGPAEGLRWYPHVTPEGGEYIHPSQRVDALLPVLTPEKEAWRFTGEDLGPVRVGQDSVGKPAVQFQMDGPRQRDFGDWTDKWSDRDRRAMAIVLNDEVVSAPSLNNGGLYGTSIIQGRFTLQEVEGMVTVLRSGSLKIRPVLEHEERVGATLGSTHVDRGKWSGTIGLIGVLGFMIAYYKGLGVFAAMSLICNLIMLMGVMTFLQATLTLPGIAGIVLTVGMAVDANILIFDRIREEFEKGRKAAPAAENGFKHALSAIIDANVTTLITAFILMKVGSGPVAGFAVTLAVGILTSVFSALVITRVFVHFQVERGAKDFPMGRWLADAKYSFSRFAKPCLMGSATMIVVGLGVFFAVPDKQKLGIDFLGGAAAKVRTQEPQTRDALADALAAALDKGTITEEIASAEIVTLPDSSAGDGKYTEFRVTFKTDGEGTGQEAKFEDDLRRAFADLLAKGPVSDIELTTADGNTANQSLAMQVHFESEHPVDDIRTALQGAGFIEPIEVSRIEGSDGAYQVASRMTFGLANTHAIQMVERAFEDRSDSSDQRMVLANPVPETTVVGSQVVGDLRDSAIRAILLSLFVVVMYIRVRFAEYSYGIAAMAAVVHDVLVVLGFLSLIAAMNAAGINFVHVEINLPMIAAFLTIIGYSLNDTIVVFDRVRENLPRMKGSLKEIVDQSINQTLSRTVMTSITTLVTLLVLFLFNVGSGSVLETFSLALLLGVMVGTYSSIFIAAPVFIWWDTRAKKRAAELSAEAAGTAA